MHLHYGDDRGTDWLSVGFARVRGLLLSAKHLFFAAGLLEGRAECSCGLGRISDTATKSAARRSVGGLPSNAGACFPVYRSLCWARGQVGKLFCELT